MLSLYHRSYYEVKIQIHKLTSQDLRNNANTPILVPIDLSTLILHPYIQDNDVADTLLSHCINDLRINTPYIPVHLFSR